MSKDKLDSRDGDEHSSASFKRRSILSKVAVGGTGLMGATSVASAERAEDSDYQILSQYSTDTKSREVLEKHSQNLIGMLLEEGIIDERSDVNLTAAMENSGFDIGVVEEGGESVPHIQTELEFSGGDLTLAVHPESGRSYGFYEPVEENGTFLLDPENDGRTQIDSQEDEAHALSSHDEECRAASCDGWKNLFVSGSMYERVDGDSWKNTGNCCSYP